MKIHLQGIGKVEAKRAIEFQVGESMLWNFGKSSKISNIEINKSGKSVLVTFEGYENKHRFLADRLIAIA